MKIRSKKSIVWLSLLILLVGISLILLDDSLKYICIIGNHFLLLIFGLECFQYENKYYNLTSATLTQDENSVDVFLYTEDKEKLSKMCNKEGD